MMVIRTLESCLAACGFLLVAASTLTAQVQRVVDCQSYPVSNSLGHYVFSAMAAHPNGRVYLGTSIKGGKFAHLVELDPLTGRVRDVADMLKVTGQTDPQMVPQSKIHTQIVVDRQGRLWFGTWAEEFRNTSFSKGYPGGHLVSYDPKTKRAVDHGILVGPRVENPIAVNDYGLYLIALDINRDKNELYILTGDEIRLLVYDITTGKHFTAGIIDAPTEHVHYGIRDLKVTADGNVYIFDHWGRIIRYDRHQQKLQPLDLWVPGSNKQGMSLPFQVGIDGSRTKIYGAGASAHRLFELEVIPETPPRIEDLGPAYGAFDGQSESSFGVVHAVVVASDGRVYYPSTGGGGRGGLFMYDPANKTRSYLGRMRVSNADPSQMTCASGGWAGCLASDGTIYFGGTDHGSRQQQLCFFAFKPAR